MSVMRVRYKKMGGHYHCRIFTAKEWHLTFANCGELCFSEDEWESVKSIMGGAEFVNDQPKQSSHD
jgi:hypothetical protein